MGGIGEEASRVSENELWHFLQNGIYFHSQKLAANNIFQGEILPDQRDKNWLLLVHCLYTNDDAKGLKKVLLN